MLKRAAEILLGGKFGKLVPVNDVECMADAIIETICSGIEISTKHERMLRARDFSVEKIVTEYELLFEKYSL